MMIRLQSAFRSANVLALEPWRAKERRDMIGGGLLLVLQLVTQSPTSANPQILLEQLGAARYADREAAAVALEKLGRESIPVLQHGRARATWRFASALPHSCRRSKGRS